MSCFTRLVRIMTETRKLLLHSLLVQSQTVVLLQFTTPACFRATGGNRAPGVKPPRHLKRNYLFLDMELIKS